MATYDLHFQPAWRLSEMLDAKQVSSRELTDLFLARIDALNPQLNAYLTVTADLARQQAADADAAIASSARRGALHGVPLSIKDLAVTKGIRTTRGSRVFAGWIPDADDIVVERVRSSGAVFLGKTNTPEFGHRGTTENRLGDPCRNPWDVTRTPGGSSGGAAAAIAAGISPVATGSDGGGSIRIPAGFTGVYGIKPSQGRVPAPYQGPGGWRPFSQNGPMARDVRDACLLLDVMAGPDPRDATAITTPAPRFVDACVPDVAGLRIAWSPDFGGVPVDSEIRAIAERAALAFADMGATVEQPTLAFDGDAILDTFRTIWLVDLVANYGAQVAGREDELDPILRGQLAEAAGWPASRLAFALHELERHRASVRDLMANYDLLLTPSLATPAPVIGDFPATIDGRAVSDPLWGFTPFTYPFNMSGNPAASIPCGFTSDNLPVGLHVVGRTGDEATVIRASAAFEQAHPWALFEPPVS
jgi:aspartyl-tRNA(Asn)/glutamyl-tRNA(Gln) amidotransferase subunit A